MVGYGLGWYRFLLRQDPAEWDGIRRYEVLMRQSRACERVQREDVSSLCNETVFLPLGRKSLFLPEFVQGAIVYFVCLSVCLCVCITFVVFTDCENCTRPIYTNPGSMEAGKYGLTRGTCFVARRIEVLTVAGLLFDSFVMYFRCGGISFF